MQPQTKSKAGFDVSLLKNDNKPFFKPKQEIEAEYLPNFKWHTRRNRIYKYFGLDDPRTTKNKDTFNDYEGPEIYYDFNSRGFRDEEWPVDIEEAKNAIWIVGDSHTFGMGLPVEHTIRLLLQEQMNMKVFDVSIDATLPPHRSRIAKRIITELEPKYLVMQWGYIWRYKRKYRTLAQEVRNKIFEKQEEHIVPDFLKIFDRVNNVETNTKIVHTFLPGFAGFNGVLEKKTFEEIPQFHNPKQPALFEAKLLDKSRDDWHMGYETHKWYTNIIEELLNA